MSRPRLAPLLLGLLLVLPACSTTGPNGEPRPGDELILQHTHDGRNLHQEDALVILEDLARLWKAPVVLHTKNDDGDVAWRVEFEEAA